jgi:hypothetical protein
MMKDLAIAIGAGYGCLTVLGAEILALDPRAIAAALLDILW